MKIRDKMKKSLKRAGSRAGSLLLLLQKTPVVQWLLPEAQIAGRAGLGEITKWTVATFAGLGAYDTVAGASVLAQLSPSAGSSTVTTAVGSNLVFIAKVTGTPGTPESWKLTGTLPSGLTHANPGISSTDTISGVPTVAGNFNITLSAYEKPNFQGGVVSANFTIIVGTAIITGHPASTTVPSGGSTTLSVTGSGSGLTYQWYAGTSPSTTNPILNATAAQYQTPALASQSSFWVKVTRSGVIANSNTAVVSIQPVAQPPVINTQPAGVTIDAGGTAMLSVTATGTAPTYQWYRGAKGDTANPVASGSTLTTPVLSATTSYWVRVTDNGLSVDSNAADVTVLAPFVTWAKSVFTTGQLADPLISGGGADPDADGFTNDQEFIAGTPPMGGTPGIPMGVVRGAGQVDLSFVATAATGAGYYGKTRHYALEERSDLTTGNWTPVTGFEDIVGAGQTVSHSIPLGPQRNFYHIKVWLTP